MAVTPGYPAEDPELFAQISHHGTRPNRSVVPDWVAAKHAKAIAAEINVDGYLRAPKTYTRP